jgi:hypothetical protein
MAASDAFDAGHEGRRDGAEPRGQDAERAGGRTDGGRSHEFNLLWR